MSFKAQVVPTQAASQHQPRPPSSWIPAAVNMTKLQPEDIFRKHAYRRQVLQDSSAGISSGDSSSGLDAGGNNNNAGAQCSGTGNLCQNTPTTVNNNQAITVYQYLPPSKILLCVYYAFNGYCINAIIDETTRASGSFQTFLCLLALA